MSFGHAEKLSYKEDVGSVGMPEIFDTPNVLQQKIEQLALMIEKSKHLVAFTGAGISTSCGIPDFRGPKGVLTLQREGKSLPEGSSSFHHAMPSITHMALVELEKAGILKFVISQNVDSLHLRSGIPREKLAELHGNSFKEVCPSCGVEYLRDFEVETVGMKETSRCCSNAKCSAKNAKGSAKLKSTVIDWEDGLPPKEMNAADKHCRMADVVLCLGTSLQITPASNLPLKSLHGGGKIVIVNLQQTPKDNKASLVIHGLVDKVIAGVMYSLNMRIPPFVRVDLFQIFFNQHCSDSKYAKWSLRVASVHGKRAPLPFIKSVVVSFPERPNLKTAVLKKEPFLLKREMLITRPLKMVLKLNLSDDCGCQFTSIEFPVDFQAPVNNINQDKNDVIQRLRDTAIQDQCCGQFLVVEREISSSPKKKIAIYAIATNIVGYSGSLASSGLSEIKLEAGTIEAPDLSVADNFVAGGDRTPSSAGFPAKPDIASPPGSPVNPRPSSPPAFVSSSPAGLVGCISADALRQKEEERRRLAAEGGLKRRSIESVAERTSWGDNQSTEPNATMPISHVPIAVETTKARTKKSRTEKRPASEQDPGVILAQPSPPPSHPSINKTGKHAGEPSRRHDIERQYSLAAVAESKQYDPMEAFDFFFKGFWKMGLVMTGLNHQFEELQRQAASSEAERQRASNLEAELGKLKLILEDKEGEVRSAKLQAAEFERVAQQLEGALDVAEKEKDAAESNLKTEKLELTKMKNALEESERLRQEAERRAAAAEDKGYEDGFMDGYIDMGERIFRDHSDWDLTPYTASTSTLTNRAPTEEDDDNQEDRVE